MKVAKTHIL